MLRCFQEKKEFMSCSVVFRMVIYIKGQMLHVENNKYLMRHHQLLGDITNRKNLADELIDIGSRHNLHAALGKVMNG